MVLRRVALSVLMLGTLAHQAHSQNQASSPAQSNTKPAVDEGTAKDRRYAMELYEQGKRIEALPWLEKLALVLPNDPVVMERLGDCLINQAATSSDPVQRKAIRVRAHQVLLRAKELGDNSDLLQIALALPEDGSEP